MTNATEASPAFGLTQLGQVAVSARDLDRATTFYRDILGLRFLFRVPNLAFFDCAGVRLMLGVPEQAEVARPSSILYFTVVDLESAYATLVARGVAFTDRPHLVATLPDHELWMAFFADSEGNTLALMSEVRQH